MLQLDSLSQSPHSQFLDIHSHHLMTKNHFRHLPVVVDDNVVGVISMSDIVRAILMALL